MSYQWRLHPYPKKRAAKPGNDNNNVSNTKYDFKLNDEIYIRPKSAKELGITGRIVDIFDNAAERNDIISTSQASTTQHSKKKRRLVEDIRVSVQQHNGAIKKGARPSRLFPVYDRSSDGGQRSAQTLIILTPDTNNYRQLATSHLRSTDKVLEIGCSTGQCTVLLLRRLILLHLKGGSKNQQHCSGSEKEHKSLVHGKIVAFDTGSDMIEQAKNSLLSEIKTLTPKASDECGMSREEDFYSHMVQCIKVDALADPNGAHAHVMNGNNRSPDMVLIDIGGNRELEGVVRMIQWVQSTFKDEPRLIIVKSEALVEELSSSTNVMGIIEQGQEWFASLSSSATANKCNSTTCNATIQKQSAPKYSHPLKAPSALSPKDDTTPICRFHNYDPSGCKRHNDSSEKRCSFDHEHCHWCREAGHVALTCPRR